MTNKPRDGMLRTRSNDGVTVNKVMMIVTGSVISFSFSLFLFMYNGDREDYRLDRAETNKYIKSIAENVQKISTSQVVSYAHQQNSDARLSKVEDRQERFYGQARGYWKDSKN